MKPGCHIRIRAACLCALLLGAHGCSVKEDRAWCPATMHLVLAARSLSLSAGSGVTVDVSGQKVRLSESEPSAFLSVPKGLLRVSGKLDNGAGNSVPWGSQSDSLWACCGEVEVLGEEAEVVLELRKRFATIFISFDPALEVRNSCVLIRGEYCGTDIASSLAPEKGEFLCQLQINDSESSVRVPAQDNGGSLGLVFCDSPGAEPRWEWDLAAQLASLGYDWSAEDLRDIHLRVTLVPTGVSVEISPWTNLNENVSI